ncbi:MAG: prepilin-type N-terminal cleavage/methylation domain-containing protein [Verrucomicrobiota bacterium]|nr:prepilin-type N-terminal cleavage/methylation domain-containing protein [Verrucomicrobiota bacterium]
MNNFNTVTTTSAPRRGFTLIELLVVITIIAILAALLGPALAAAKKRATLAACLSGQRELQQGWQGYADDHHGNEVPMTTGGPTAWRIGYPFPGITAPAGLSPVDALKWQAEQGYRQGALFSYAPNVDIIHCPGDIRWEAGELAFDSFSGPQGLNGGNSTKKTGDTTPLTKESQIAHPSGRFVFVEENDSRNDNEGSWEVHLGKAPQFLGSSWIDSPAAFHIDSSTFGFADGHVEAHRWLFQDTINMANSTDTSTSDGVKFYHQPKPANNADILYVAKHFPCVQNP